MEYADQHSIDHRDNIIDWHNIIKISNGRLECVTDGIICRIGYIPERDAVVAIFATRQYSNSKYDIDIEEAYLLTELEVTLFNTKIAT